MARSPVKKPPEPDPADLALLEELHAELGERDAQIERLTRVLQRKQDERDLLHSNFSQLVLQVQALRGQVAERLGVELPEAAGAPADARRRSRQNPRRPSRRGRRRSTSSRRGRRAHGGAPALARGAGRRAEGVGDGARDEDGGQD